MSGRRTLVPTPERPVQVTALQPRRRAAERRQSAIGEPESARPGLRRRGERRAVAARGGCFLVCCFLVRDPRDATEGAAARTRSTRRRTNTTKETPRWIWMWCVETSTSNVRWEACEIDESSCGGAGGRVVYSDGVTCVRNHRRHTFTCCTQIFPNHSGHERGTMTARPRPPHAGGRQAHGELQAGSLKLMAMLIGGCGEKYMVVASARNELQFSSVQFSSVRKNGVRHAERENMGQKKKQLTEESSNRDLRRFALWGDRPLRYASRQLWGGY